MPRQIAILIHGSHESHLPPIQVLDNRVIPNECEGDLQVLAQVSVHSLDCFGQLGQCGLSGLTVSCCGPAPVPGGRQLGPR